MIRTTTRVVQGGADTVRQLGGGRGGGGGQVGHQPRAGGVLELHQVLLQLRRNWNQVEKQVVELFHEEVERLNIAKT